MNGVLSYVLIGYGFFLSLNLPRFDLVFDLLPESSVLWRILRRLAHRGVYMQVAKCQQMAINLNDIDRVVLLIALVII